MRMLPVLDAEESMRAVERLAVGTGAMKSDGIRTVTRRWQRTIDEAQPRPTTRRLATPETLAGMGIGFCRVTKA